MNITWDEERYENNFSFVHHYGEAVLDLIDAEPGSVVLDLGCGNGALTQALADRGFAARGLDDSAQMVAAATKAYPGLSFMQANAIDFTLDEPVDVIFSNAVLHWIDREDQPTLLRSVARALKPGGQFVFECGGFGNTDLIHRALARAFEARGLAYRIPQYYPTIGEYASLIEAAGMQVTFATLFDRLTPLTGEDGVADWIRLFVQKPFEGMDAALVDEIIHEAAEATRERLFIDGVWYADYVRLRMKAHKIPEVPKKPYSLKPVTRPLSSQPANDPASKASDSAANTSRFRDITEDDDGYHPYADVPDMRPLFERDPWR